MLRLHFGVDDVARTRFSGGGLNGRHLALGVAEALNSLHPRISWRSPVLEVRATGSREVRLQGCGLLLQCVVGPFQLIMDTGVQPVLRYPAQARDQAVGAHADPLTEVLGRTRAKALRALENELTTTELARSLGVSPATASQSAAALRGAGLIATRRQGKEVRHRMTRKGWEMLVV
ncbi:hypothetical protein BBK82_31310 [Lentzea guizhouensis]|uniref:HTH arsR-type domain-containing protein n=1 Tax=Lentzea guizhouensis TaxID=1586287 RepID=A0A1B2HQ71_9PSEU|nr:helix-turn-helix domain-containing protein [Lentzea guizhouensis]ANZ39868.1 hypothetical protein BBK82_31310 [Lentzea guizhouensis]